MSVTAPTTPAAPPSEMQPSGRAVVLRWIRPTLDVVASVVVVLAFGRAPSGCSKCSPFIFPAPIAILWSLWLGISSGKYLSALGVTLSEILAGAVIGAAAGLLIAIVMVSSRLIYRLIYPWIVGIQTIPKVAIAPLMLVWFGFGIEFEDFDRSAHQHVPGDGEHDFRSAGDRPRPGRACQGTMRKPHASPSLCAIPAALPYIFAGLNTAIVLAVIAAIVGEFVGARAGIGYLILQANFALDLAAVFALLTLLGVLGVTLSLCIRAIENRICFWNRRS